MLKHALIILQARMNSTRLPQKSLRILGDKPLVQHAIDRLSQLAIPLVTAIPNTQSDDLLARYLSHDYYRGSELDVLDRFYQCAIHYQAKHIIRATADNPFVDINALQSLIECYQQQELDYANNLEAVPHGLGTEIMSFEALARSWREGTAPRHREHVNEYILEHPELFRCHTLRAHTPDLHFTVDTESDFFHAEQIYSTLSNKHHYTTEDLIRVAL